MKRFVTIGFSALTVCAYGQRNFQLDSTRVSKLNVQNKAETYPFLSADGLRLYFTADRRGFPTIYFSDRKSINDHFSNSKPLTKHALDSFYEASLTIDELSIYLFKDDTLYYSTRRSKKNKFSKPKLIPEITDCHFAPAISPDGRELIAIKYWGCDSTMNHNNRMDHFIKDKNGVFKFYESLTIDSKYEVQPGQFSKDGLEFFMTIQPKLSYTLKNKVDTSILVRFERAQLQDRFSSYTEVYTTYLQNHLTQVSFNKEKTALVGVTGNRWEWEKTNLTYYRILSEK
jgi:hypothetical protein